MLRIFTLVVLVPALFAAAALNNVGFAQQANTSGQSADQLPAAYPPAYLKDRSADFVQRARDALKISVDDPRPALEGSVNPTRAILNYGIAALALQYNASRANDHIAKVELIAKDKKAGIRHLSLAHAIRLYMLYNDKSSYMPGRLAPTAQAHLEAEFAQALQLMIDTPVKRPGYGSRFDDIPNTREGVWPGASENIWMQRAHFNFLAWQSLAKLPAYKDKLYDHHTPAEHYERWRTFFRVYLDELAKKGLFLEVGAGYEPYTLNPLYNLHDFAADPAIRAKAGMILDLWVATAGERAIKYVQGGGKSRVKGTYRYEGRHGMWNAFYIWFGPPDNSVRHDQDIERALFESTTAYFPSPTSAAIAADLPTWNSRGTYEYVERRMGMRASPKENSLSFEKTVLHYGFVTSSYVIGAALLDPNRNAPTYFSSAMARWQGIIFNGDADGSIFPDIQLVKPSSGKEETLDSDAFYTVQDRNVMLLQKSWRLTSGPAKGANFKTRIYFSPTLDAVEEDACWIFAREGTAFAAISIAIRGNGCGYTWAQPWRHQDKATPRNYNYVYLTDADGMAPIIMVANEQADYGGDFERFKAAIKAQPINHVSDRLEFAGSTLYLAQKDKQGKYLPASTIGLRGNTTIDTSPLRVFDSPFVRSAWDSGVIYLRKGNSTEVLDFSNGHDPAKISGGPVTSMFPQGIGEAHPIILGEPAAKRRP